jgi:hypothetical protein
MTKHTDHNFNAWCSQHQEHPNDCFEKHRPDSKEVAGALDEQAHRDSIAKLHREMGGGSGRN